MGICAEFIVETMLLGKLIMPKSASAAFLASCFSEPARHNPVTRGSLWGKKKAMTGQPWPQEKWMRAPLLRGGRKCFHGGDQSDQRLTGSALSGCTGQHLGADDAAALGLGTEAGATPVTAGRDTLGGSHRHTIGNDMGCLTRVDSTLAFLIGGHLLLGRKGTTAGQQAAAG